MPKINCPKCNTDSVLSLSQELYQGPFRCWKCRATYTIRVENDVLKSCEPLDQQEFDRMRPKRPSQY